MATYPSSHTQEFHEAGLLFVDRSIAVHKFKPSDYERLTKAKAISDLTPVALEIIDRLGGRFAIGIGPMRTGTKRSFIQNLQIFDRAYDWLIQADPQYRLSVFYQVAFEVDIHRIRAERYADDDMEFIDVLFEYFYRPILTHPNLTRVIRMPDWKMSKGAMIEHDILLSRKEQVEFIDAIDHVPDLKELLRGEPA